MLKEQKGSRFVNTLLHDMVQLIVLFQNPSVQKGGQVFNRLSVPFCASDPPSAELDQLELPVLCDGLRRYLQDLPQPIIPTAVYAQMVHTAKGESRRPLRRSNFCLLTEHFVQNRSADVKQPRQAIEHSVL